MNTLNKIFDKIYVISSYTTQNRLNYLIPFLKGQNIKYELVISPKKKYFGQVNEDNLWLGQGNFSVISANESIFLKEYYQKSESFCILEDDVVFDENYQNKLTRFLKEVPKDWDILNLGFHIDTPINSNIDKSNIFYKVQPSEEVVGGHMIVYKKNVVSNILDEMEKSKLPMDWFLTKYIYSNVNTYVCVDKIFYAGSYRECEADKNAFYKKYKSSIV